MSDLVSIIMPSYNTAQYITETIQSVIDQTYHNWEYVIKQWYNASIVTYVLALIMSRISLVEIGLWSLVHKR